jgi:hypothetical protein
MPQAAAPVAAAAEPAPVAAVAAAAAAPHVPHQAASTASHAAARVPSIRFPPRRTLSGEVISTLSASAQAAALAAVGSGGGGGGSAPSTTTTTTTITTTTTTTRAVPLSQRISGLYASPSDTKWYAGKERGVKLTASRLLSDKEMELIELGGAV